MEKGSSQPSLLKESETHISCKKKLLLFLCIVYSMPPAEEGVKEIYAKYAHSADLAPPPPPPSESIVYLLHRKMKE
jgi:hypothetical protein